MQPRLLWNPCLSEVDCDSDFSGLQLYILVVQEKSSHMLSTLYTSMLDSILGFVLLTNIECSPKISCQISCYSF